MTDQPAKPENAPEGDEPPKGYEPPSYIPPAPQPGENPYGEQPFASPAASGPYGQPSRKRHSRRNRTASPRVVRLNSASPPTASSRPAPTDSPLRRMGNLPKGRLRTGSRPAPTASPPTMACPSSPRA